MKHTVIFIFLLILIGCDYPNKMWYKETWCNDPWHADPDLSIHKQNIQHYLDSVGISTSKIEIYKNDQTFFCWACSCKSGLEAYIWVKDEDVEQAKLLGFEH